MQCMEIWGGNQLVDSNVELPGLDAWVYSRPYRDAKLGGDLHYVSSCATGRITRLLLADVSGHGEPVGEITVALRELMRRYIHYFSQNQFVEAMNNEFTRLSETGLFATAVVTSFFAPTRELSISNAGHPTPFVFHVQKGQWTLLESQDGSAKSRSNSVDLAPTNIPLGIMDATLYDQLDIRLDVGDMVLCYTDSLIESDGPDGKMLGVAGLMNTLETLETGDPSTFINRLLEAIGSQSPGNLTQDDVTVLLFRPNGQASTLTLTQKLLAPFRVMKGIFASILKGNTRWPWPEMTLRNFGLDFLAKSSKD